MNGNEMIGSGMLELYVMGMTDPEECRLVERMATLNPEVRTALDRINESIMAEAMEQGVAPPPLVKPFLMATIHYFERIRKGEEPGDIPELHKQSTAADYEPWLTAPGVSYEGKEDIYAHILSLSPEKVAAVVWLRSYVPDEVHDDQLESLLILEGSCEFTVGSTVHQLKPGDHFEVPLHQTHSVKVTSETPCKAILQRIAA